MLTFVTNPYKFGCIIVQEKMRQGTVPKYNASLQSIPVDAFVHRAVSFLAFSFLLVYSRKVEASMAMGRGGGGGRRDLSTHQFAVCHFRC